MHASMQPAPAGAFAPSPSLTRRRLLQASGLALAGAAATQLSRVLPASLVAPRAAGQLHRSRFVPLVGQQVRLTAADGRSVQAHLASVEDFPGRHMAVLAGSPDAFILLFHGPSSPRLEQDVLRVSHPRLGQLQLLVSPAGTGRRGQDYAAVINRARWPRH